MFINSVIPKCFVVLLLCTLGACSATHFQADCETNPLPVVAEKAADEFSVEWVDETALNLRDTWPVHSVLNIGWTTFHANLRYNEGQLRGVCYLRMVGLGQLYIPTYISLGGDYFGAALKPYMRKQLAMIVDWAGLKNNQVIYNHGVDPDSTP